MLTVQVVIIGQGLAGTAPAWSLKLRGVDFVVVDSGSPSTSSKIAAGLVTPYTGKRAAKSWAWDDAWRLANEFYPEIENRTGTHFWKVQSALRLYASAAEREFIQARLSNSSAASIEEYIPDGNASSSRYIDSSHGGFVMNSSARLDSTEYLNASRAAFELDHAYRQSTIELETAFDRDGDWIRIRNQSIRGRAIILCQGYAPEANRWFPRLPFVAAQGDILTLRIPDLRERRTVHRGIWLAPVRLDASGIDEGIYWTGSTYRWQALDGLPSVDGREQILTRLKEWLKAPFDVVEHRAAIRPSSFDQRPLLGPSRVDSRFWVFNGLGTKGALLAPWSAQQLCDCLLHGAELNPMLRWDRRLL